MNAAPALGEELKHSSRQMNKCKPTKFEPTYKNEIDLHLHPSLEQEVLARLKKTFPSIQFIVSTHSPMVLSNLKVKDTGNMIYRMQADEDTPNALPNLYGVDYSAAVYDFMGTPYADNEPSVSTSPTVSKIIPLLSVLMYIAQFEISESTSLCPKMLSTSSVIARLSSAKTSLRF